MQQFPFIALIAVVAGEEGFFVFLKSAVCERFADAVNGVDNEMFVVNTGENFSGDFVGFEKVVQVGTRVIFTAFTVAARHKWTKIVSKFSIFDVNATIVGIERAIPRHAGGANAVESITTEFGTDE